MLNLQIPKYCSYRIKFINVTSMSFMYNRGTASQLMKYYSERKGLEEWSLSCLLHKNVTLGYSVGYIFVTDQDI
jgi:hypothetical protein